jgi:hypothetical protein
VLTRPRCSLSPDNQTNVWNGGYEYTVHFIIRTDKPLASLDAWGGFRQELRRPDKRAKPTGAVLLQLFRQALSRNSGSL